MRRYGCRSRSSGTPRERDGSVAAARPHPRRGELGRSGRARHRQRNLQAMDYTAVGQTASRRPMEQLAEPGSILLSPATLELAEGYIEVKPLGPLPVKGLPEPVQVAARRCPGRALPASRGRGPGADPLCRPRQRAGSASPGPAPRPGRARPGRHGGWRARCTANPRLYWEFTHSHRVHGWLILESGSVSYGKATAYLPVIELLKAYFHIEGPGPKRGPSARR